MTNLTQEEVIAASMPEVFAPGKTELYVAIALLFFLCIMGTVGNALVLYVFSKKKDKMVSTLFIVVMAVVDFSTCIVIIPATIYMEFVDFKLEIDILCKVYQFLITSNIPFSALIMVAIAVDRYLCICHPFLHLLNIARAKVMTAALALFATALGVVVALMYGVYQIKGDVKKDTKVTIVNGNVTNYNTSSVEPFYMIEPESTTAAPSSTFNTTMENAAEKIEIIYTGSCAPNELIMSSTFMRYYQKFYIAMYLVCLGIVIVLYSLIYKSVMTRRMRRAKQKSKALPIVVMKAAENDGTTTCEETLLTNTVDRDIEETVVNGSGSGSVKNGKQNGSRSKKEKKSKEEKKRDKERKKSKKGDKTRMANLKTAAMLFVVTVVFIVTFLPAFLMMLELLPYNVIVFYLYFANNVANPIIYSFMNVNFRDDLKKIFCRP